MNTLPSSTFTGLGAYQSSSAPVIGPTVTIQEIRDSLSLARIKVGAAIDLIETTEYDGERLFEVNVHAETVASDADTLLQSISNITSPRAADA